MSGTITGGIIAFFVGGGLAVATAVGVVQVQQSAGTEEITSSSSAVSYGANN